MNSAGSFPPVKALSRIAAENNPHREAFSDGATGRSVIWEEFNAESIRAANALREYVAGGDRVAFVCDASIDHAILWNGALKAGCIPSNLHVRTSPATLRYCIDTLRPRVVVVDDQYDGFVRERVLNGITTDLNAMITLDPPATTGERTLDRFVDGYDTTSPDVRVREDDVATVLWTSGTTGRPKGWCLSNRGAVMRGTKLIGGLGIRRTTRRIQTLSPSFAAWFTGTMPALLTHSTTYFLREWDPETYLQVIQDHEMTMATLVPTMWRNLLTLEDFDEYDLGSLRRITAAGERLDATTLERLEENVCDRVYNAFAATEVAATAMANDEMDAAHVESVGKPLIASEIRIIEEGGDPADTLEPGEVGEIIVKAPDTVEWVWGDSEKTEEAFTDGWWHSGDLGYTDEDGYLFLEGRTDFMILSKGIKVYPVPVEERLSAHPAVEEAAVVGVEDDEYGEKVTAVLKTEGEVTAEDLDAWCLEADELARHERPRKYHFVKETLPRTATNKLDRAAVLENFKPEL